MQRELQTQLSNSGKHVADVLRLFDQDAGSEMLIDDMEFVSTMRTRFHYRGPFGVLREVFKSLDSDGSHQIGFDELCESKAPNPHTHAAHTRASPAQQ